MVDEAHEETRRRIRAGDRQLLAGVHGLGLGLLGGVTSLVKHSYEGAASEGLPGFLAGVGKGLVGTVTKPVIGVLDLAAGTAAAVRERARRPERTPIRARPPRCPAGPDGLLTRYSARRSEDAALLHRLSGGRRDERALALLAVRGPPHDIRALFSTRHVRVVTGRASPHVVMETHLANLVSCAAVQVGDAHYVELVVSGGSAGGGGGDAVRRPRVQCDSEQLAQQVARLAHYAAQLHRHELYTVPDH